MRAWLRPHEQPENGTALADGQCTAPHTICELGKEWEDPSKIPVDEIVEECGVHRVREGALRVSHVVCCRPREEPSAAAHPQEATAGPANDEEDMARRGVNGTAGGRESNIFRCEREYIYCSFGAISLARRRTVSLLSNKHRDCGPTGNFAIAGSIPDGGF